MELSRDGHTITGQVTNSESEMAETRPPDVSDESTDITKHDIRSKYTSSSPVESGSQSGVAGGQATGSNSTGVNNGQMETNIVNVFNSNYFCPHSNAAYSQHTKAIDMTDETIPRTSTVLRDVANGCELNITSSSHETTEKVSDDEFGEFVSADDCGPVQTSDKKLLEMLARQAAAVVEQACSENSSDYFRNMGVQMRIGNICHSSPPLFPNHADLSQSGSTLCKDAKRSPRRSSIDMSASVTTTPEVRLTENRLDKTALEEEAADDCVPSSDCKSQESESKSESESEASLLPKRGLEDSMKRCIVNAEKDTGRYFLRSKMKVDLKDIHIRFRVKTEYNILRTVEIAELNPYQLRTLYRFLDRLYFEEWIMNTNEEEGLVTFVSIHSCPLITVDLSRIPDRCLRMDTMENIKKIVDLAQYQPSQTSAISSFIHEIWLLVWHSRQRP